MRVVAGIDPGLSGGIAVIRQDGKVLMNIVTPTLSKGREKRLDVDELKRLFLEMTEDLGVEFVLLEKFIPAPRVSSQSLGTTGSNYGILLGLLHGLGIHVEERRPKEIFAGLPTVKGSLFDSTRRVMVKKRNIRVATKLFPEVNLIPEGKRVPHDGLADALLIANYGLSL